MPYQPISFNRTFMELKYGNECRLSCGKKSFNRTFMELKLVGFRQRRTNAERFNRTFMELKFGRKAIAG